MVYFIYVSKWLKELVVPDGLCAAQYFEYKASERV